MDEGEPPLAEGRGGAEGAAQRSMRSKRSWASGEPPAKPSGLKRARLTTHGDFLNRLLRGLKRARLSTHGNFLNMRMTTRAAHAPRRYERLLPHAPGKIRTLTYPRRGG